MSDKIPSRCCHGFILPETPTFEDVRTAFRGRLKLLRENVRDNPALRRNGWALIEDLRTLQLLVPIDPKDVAPAMMASVTETTRRHLTEGRDVLWTCKHLNPETGACGIYEKRPFMCRTFPGNDTENRVDGHNRLCYHCTSTYCTYHPETVQ